VKPGAGVNAVTGDRMRRRIDELVASDPNVRTLSYLLGPQGLLQWAHCVGVATDDALARCVAPLPPLELRSIVADSDVAPFLYAGFMDASIAARVYEEYGPQREDRPAVLDFGCGCGRVMRFFDPGAWTIYGSEINPHHAEWCNANLPGIRTLKNGFEPPLALPDASIDYVYTFSVFSHLSREGGAAWLADLARVLKPGGIAMITTHGPGAAQIIAGSAPHQSMFRLTAAEAAAIGDRLPTEGVIYLPYDQDVLDVAHAGPSYGNTFIDPGYAKRAWANDDLAVTAHLPGGVRGWQDVYVLTRR
jgi:SAM-dependent methyltransferase